MQTINRFLPLFLVLATVVSTTQARIDQPSHVFYGNATLYGQAVESGTVVEARLAATGESLVSYSMGRDSRLNGQYALPIPMDGVDPRRSGHARPGNEVEIFIGNQLAAETTVGAIGRAIRLDIDPQFLEGGPTISIEGSEAFEGDSGNNTQIDLPVTMSTTSDENVSIQWQTSDGSAIGAASCEPSVDYISDSGTLTIPAGSQQGAIRVTACPDNEAEADEAFTVELTSTTNGSFANQTAQVTLLDDDDNPEIMVADTWVEEPSAGTAEAVFAVSLSRNHDRAVSFDWQTDDMTATAGQDYVADQGTIEFEAGEITAEIRVTILADSEVESQEALALRLSNAHLGKLERSTATAIIEDPEFDPTLRHEQDVINDENGIRGIPDPTALAVSHDHQHVYVTSESTGELTILKRTVLSGKLTMLDSINASTSGFESMLMDGPVDITISDDDAHVYVAAKAADAIIAFTRNETDGSLSFQGNYVDDSNGIAGIQEVTRLALSPDGRHLYASGLDSVAVFERDTSTGELTFLEAEINNVEDSNDSGSTVKALDRPAGLTVSPTGDQLLVTSRLGDALLVFDRDKDDQSPDFGQLSFNKVFQDNIDGIEGLRGATDVAISASGRQVYVSAEAANTLVRFNRDTNGNLTQHRIWTSGEEHLPGMQGAQHLALAPDNVELFVTGFADSSFTVFRRTSSDEDAANAGDLVVSQTLFDDQGRTEYLAGPTDIVVSHDDRHVYVVANEDNAIVVFTRLSADEIFTDPFMAP